MIKVEALNEWKKENLKCKDLKPERIPTEGEQWEVDEKRLEVLLGKNSYGKAFVKVVEEDNLKELKKTLSTFEEIPVCETIAKDTIKEKPIKKTTAKKK